MDISERLAGCTGFGWDTGNFGKNREKHGAEFWEAEQVFSNHPLAIVFDAPHSHSEERFYCLGQTDAQRSLFVVFTLRRDLIRVISARDMSRKEREAFQAHEKAQGPSL